MINSNKNNDNSTHRLFFYFFYFKTVGRHGAERHQPLFRKKGLKAACHRFQVASGIFQHVRENVVGGLVGTLTQDLIPDGLTAASTLMLAQVGSGPIRDSLYHRLKPKDSFFFSLFCVHRSAGQLDSI